MKNFNTWILNLTVAIIDFLYQGRDYQRFWVLEEKFTFFLECTTLERITRSTWSRTHLSDGGTFCSNS